MKDAELILALLLTQGIGRVAINTLLRVARSLNTPLQTLRSSPEALIHGPLGNALPGPIADFLRERNESLPKAAHLCARVIQQGILPITMGSSNYPKALSDILGDYAPPILFIKGNPDLLHRPALAIVGTRDPSDKGNRIATACAMLVSQHEVFLSEDALVVSGGARGVDTTAHHAALATGGKTLVIVPQGILTFHADPVLARGLDNGTVTIVSEFRPDNAWETHAAVTRNATISSLARVVCVVEPWKLGGSIRTARIALEQRKPVLVCYRTVGDTPAQVLQKAGALSLTDTDGLLSKDTILASWKRPIPVLQAQSELF